MSFVGVEGYTMRCFCCNFAKSLIIQLKTSESIQIVAIFKRAGVTDILGLIFLTILVFSGSSLSGDPGVGWHLKTGEWIAAHQNVPRSDPFLLTANPHSWIANQWLSDLILWVLYSVGGWALVQVSVIGILLTAYVVVVGISLRRLAIHPLVAFFVVLLVCLCGSVQWFVRPVVFSFLLFSVVYCAIQKLFLDGSADAPRRLPKAYWGLPLLFAFWANLHPAFPLGLSLIGMAAVAEAFSRGSRGKGRFFEISALFGICVLATLINPYGVALWSNILGLLGNPYFMKLNKEWNSVDFTLPLFMGYGFSLALLFLLLIRTRAKVLSVFDVITLIVFIYLSLTQRRYVPFFAIIFSVPFAKLFYAWLTSYAGVLKSGNVEEAFGNISRKELDATVARYSVIGFLSIFVLTAVLGTVPPRAKAEFSIDRNFPAEAVTALERLTKGSFSSDFRVFHTPNWGGYLTWRLWPTVRPFIDDRNQLNGQLRYEHFFVMRDGKEGWEELIERYRFNVLLLEADAALVTEIERVSEWAVYYSDDQAKIFVRQQIFPSA